MPPRSPWKSRHFVAEFTAFSACQLIDVAIVGKDGREFYTRSPGRPRDEDIDYRRRRRYRDQPL